ncbi:hypothetical protein B0H14DRAFT_3513511 [Mycena olivaceomarginata]|nr:hypothetical protein B0H14DRAFT_3513511 [Mycena olivaceomarginata]
MALDLGLLYLGCLHVSGTTIETLKAIEHPILKTRRLLSEAMLHHCDEHIDMKEKRRPRIGLWYFVKKSY